MKGTAYHALRLGLAITFLWIGILILENPDGWGGYIQPWVEDFLPTSIRDTMITTAIFDLVVGFLLLIDSFVWIATALAALHLILVLIVSGITEVTVRDIAILAGSLALFIETLPQSVVNKFRNKNKEQAMPPVQ